MHWSWKGWLMKGLVGTALSQPTVKGDLSGNERWVGNPALFHPAGAPGASVASGANMLMK